MNIHQPLDLDELEYHLDKQLYYDEEEYKAYNYDVMHPAKKRLLIYDGDALTNNPKSNRSGHVRCRWLPNTNINKRHYGRAGSSQGGASHPSNDNTFDLENVSSEQLTPYYQEEWQWNFPVPKEELREWFDKMMIEAGLKKWHREIIWLHMQGKTFRDIAKRKPYSFQNAWKLYKTGMKKLQNYINSQEKQTK